MWYVPIVTGSASIRGGETLVPLTNSEKFAIVDDGWEEDVLCQPWHLTKKGYARTSSSPYKIYLQHLIMGKRDGYEIDHINGDKLDNREANLRWVNDSQQMWNRGIQKRNKSGYPGVHPTPFGRWTVSIGINRKTHYLGNYVDLNEAIAVRKKAEQEWHGEYARKER